MSKTFQDFLDHSSDDDVREALQSAQTADELAEAAVRFGYEFTAAEVREYLLGMSDEEMADISGGIPYSEWWRNMRRERERQQAGRGNYDFEG